MYKRTAAAFLATWGAVLLLAACRAAQEPPPAPQLPPSSPAAGPSQSAPEPVPEEEPAWLPSPGPGETTPELFLAARTEEELLRFIDAGWSAVGGPGMERGFASPADIGSEGLMSFFFRTADSLPFYREDIGEDGEERRYCLIPLEAVTRHLDRYFDGYTFRMEDTAWVQDYDPKKQELFSRSFTGWGDSITWKLVGAAAETDKNVIFITADRMDPEDPEKALGTATVRLSFGDGGLKFLSFRYFDGREGPSETALWGTHRQEARFSPR